MAKSRNRGGAKAHRKRVKQRNEKLGIQRKQFQKVFSEMYETKMKEMLEKMSATTENSENVDESNENTTVLNYEETISPNEKTEESNTESQSSSSN